MAAAVETDRWAMFRGDASRNASTVGGAPLLNLRWRVDVADDPILEKALSSRKPVSRARSRRVLRTPPAGRRRHGPHAHGDERAGGRFPDGQAALADDAPKKTRDDPRPNRFNGVLIGGRNNMSQPAQYGQRIWDDATYGTLSSDGNLVFVIEELPLGVSGGRTADLSCSAAAATIRRIEASPTACRLRHPDRQAAMGVGRPGVRWSRATLSSLARRCRSAVSST